MNVNDEVKKEVIKDLDAAIERLSKIQKEHALAKEAVLNLNTQLVCSHTWELVHVGCDTCMKCGRVWEY